MLHCCSVIGAESLGPPTDHLTGCSQNKLLLPDIAGFNNLAKTGAEQLMRIAVTGRPADRRLALKMFLQNRLGLDVVAEANDVQTLLAQTKAAQPDVILMDWALCDQPLEDLVSALDLLECRPGLIFINIPAESRQAALAAGVDACVVKGTPPKKLLIAIESVRIMRQEKPNGQ